MAKTTLTDNQVVFLGITLVKNMNDYENALTTWFAKPADTRTWTEFKTHFTAAQDQLRLLRGPTMQSSIIQGQMNALSQRFMQDMTAEHNEYLSAVAASEQRLLHAMEMNTASTGISTLTIITQSVHSTSASTTDSEMIRILKSIQSSLQAQKISSQN